MQMHIKNWWDKKKNKRLLFYIYLSLVFIFTLTPINHLKPSFLDGFIFEGADKIVHVLIFIVMSFFLFQAYNINIYLGFLFLFLIGILIEFLQENLNLGRSFEMLDIAADTLGIVLFISLYSSIKNKYLN